MGKRQRRAGCRSPASSSPGASVFNESMLRSRIHAAGVADLDEAQVVNHLRSLYPDYSRIKSQPFVLRVRRVLQSLRIHRRPQSSSSSDEDDEDEEDGRRLLRSESDHLQKRRRRLQRSAESQSETSSSGEGAADNSTSTSDDAIFESKFEPEYDILKSMLREAYRGKNAKHIPEVNKNIEVDDASLDKQVKSLLPMADATAVRNNDVLVRKSEGAGGRPLFSDLGGMEGVIEELMMEVIVPLCHPQLLVALGVRPMAGILLHGPPGCGKTKLAHAIANETGVPFYKISATEVVSGVSGTEWLSRWLLEDLFYVDNLGSTDTLEFRPVQCPSMYPTRHACGHICIRVGHAREVFEYYIGASEENIRDLFKKAYRTAPSIIFIDEIDAIASKRENLQREMERRIVTQLMTCMDESHQTLRSNADDPSSEMFDKKPGFVLVIGATNRPDAVDQALRRPGRFDREIVLGVPDENARAKILSVLTRSLKLKGHFNLFKIARSTPGFVGADLAALVNKAGNLAMKRIVDRRKSELSSGTKSGTEDWWRKPWAPEEMDSLSITMADFEEAARLVQPPSRREGFSSVPNVKWEDVGGLNSLRKEFDRYIVQRIRHPEEYEEFGVNLEAGFLLYGPPGCGKTLIAKAVANEAGASFIHIKGPELLNKYVGESELAVRTIFSRARTCSPCILFFDEVDALTTKRGKEGGWVVERLLNQLLIELDGADQRQGVYVIGATNRIEVMDPAVLRPGRFGKVLYVPLPGDDERGLIMKALARSKPIADDVDLDAIGRSNRCKNLTGADLAAVMNEAAMAALEEKQRSLESGTSTSIKCLITASHIEQALGKLSPSVSEKQRIHYEGFSRNYRIT